MLGLLVFWGVIALASGSGEPTSVSGGGSFSAGDLPPPSPDMTSTPPAISFYPVLILTTIVLAFLAAIGQLAAVSLNALLGLAEEGFYRRHFSGSLRKEEEP